MKKILLPVLLFLGCTAAYAQPIEPGGILLNGGFSLAFIAGGETSDSLYNSGIEFQTGVGYVLHPMLEVHSRLSFGRFELKDEFGQIFTGRSMSTLGANIGLRASTGTALAPYVHALGGIHRVSVDDGVNLEAGHTLVPGMSETQASVTLGGGIGWNVDGLARLSVEAELIRVFTEDESLTFVPIGLRGAIRL
jgi:hypothetical protein